MKNKLNFLILLLIYGGTSSFLKAQITIEYLVVGGGGGGGNGNDRTSGGGSGGKLVSNSVSINSGSYSVTVGAGGSSANNGNQSSISGTGLTTITAIGGGRGGSNSSGPTCSANAGGRHHGGGSGLSCAGGNSGGGGQDDATNNIYNAGGGGGAGGAGQNGSSGSAGGAGASNSFRTGSSATYGAGGSGGRQSSTSTSASNGSNGGANTGNGGNGGRSAYQAGATTNSVTGGSGGSGIVVIRYASTVDLADGGATETTYSSGGITYRVHIFTSSGTFTYTGTISGQPSNATQNICINGAATPLSVTATGSSPTYQWYSNTTPSNIGGTIISGAGAQLASYSPPTNVAGTRYYYCYVTNSTSNQTSNVSGAININTPSKAGTISGANTVTSGSNSTILTLSGHIGTVQWQSSTNGTTFGNASGTSTNTTYTATNLVSTTHYRAVVTSGSCASVTSSSTTILVLPSTTPTSTSLSISGTGTTNTMSRNTATFVDDGLTITGSGNISGFSVSITENYSSGDVLGYTGSLPSGVTTSGFSTTSRSIVFRGNAIASVWQTFLRTITLTSTAGTCNPEKRKVTFTVSTNFYNYFNGHYYEYVSSGRIWSDAKANAESKSFFGRQGYLANISSAEENAYISKLIGQNSWLGATDNYLEINKALGYAKYSSQSQAEGKYHWVTGPEKGIQISNGSSSITGRYLRWAGGEPNNYNTGFKDKSLNLYGEHYLHIYSSSSTWNDFPDDRRLGSIIEYGGMSGDNPVIGIEFTRDVIISGLTSGSISGGLGTVCAGTNTTILTLTGASGTVARWESSDDNFLSNTQNISNSTTSLNASNISEKTFYRAVMVNGSCTLPTPSTYINVLELDGGVVSAESNEGCANSAINLTLGGHKGTVTKWQITSNPVGTISDISSTSTSLSHTISTAGSYYIRTEVGNSSCSNSTQTDWYPIEVNASGAPTSGSVNSAAHCGGANSGVLTLKGSKGGSTYQWQESTNGGSSWTNASSTSTRFSYVDINRNTQYRVVVSKGSCGSATSSIGEITIYGTDICQWTGEGSDNNWSTATNWCAQVVGTNGRKVAISEFALSDPVLDASINLAEVNFSASGKKITLGNWNIEVENILGADSLNYFKTNDTGSLIKSISNLDSFTFSVGLSNYKPVSIINKTGETDQFSVYVFDEVFEKGKKGNGKALVNKSRIQSTWEIGKLNVNSGLGVDFTFEWELSNKKGDTFSSTSLNHFNKNIDDWEFVNYTSIIRGNNFLTLRGYTGTFSPFAIGGGMTALPIYLHNFIAIQNNKTVDLTWSSFSPNKNPFNILKSNDGINWISIGYVNPKENVSNFLFKDHHPETLNYYKLSQRDNSNSLNYSEIKLVVFNNNQSFQIYPNPSDGNIQIKSIDEAQFQITDLTGKIIAEDKLLNSSISIQLEKGIYFIKIMNEFETYTQKIIIQ